MKEFFNFMSESPFLGFLIICSAYYLIKYTVFILPNRILRTINMNKNGWPPEHCDADGDFKKEDDND